MFLLNNLLDILINFLWEEKRSLKPSNCNKKALTSSSVLLLSSFIIFASRGDATVFGTMASSLTNGAASASDSTRGLMFGGYAAPATLNVIQYITMASSGNGVDFGDLTIGRSSLSAASNAHGGLG